MDYLLLIIGFIFLIKGADYFVDGSSSIAKKLHISPITIGMTIIAIGTSLPEIIISSVASYNNENGMAIGNILGSNILNICIVLGVVSIIVNVPVEQRLLKKEFPVLILSEILLLVLGLSNRELNRLEGIIIFSVFILFVLYVIETSKNNKKKCESNEQFDNQDILETSQIIIYLLIGGIAIKYGGDLVVDAASNIAINFGMSYNLIGLTVIAFGTSLPELVTSIIAASKGEVDLALGNVIGSNMFNILLALSTASIINPIPFSYENIIDCLVCIGITIITFIFAKINRVINRYEGIILVCLYIGYFSYIFLR